MNVNGTVGLKQARPPSPPSCWEPWARSLWPVQYYFIHNKYNLQEILKNKMSFLEKCFKMKYKTPKTRFISEWILNRVNVCLIKGCIFLWNVKQHASTSVQPDDGSERWWIYTSSFCLSADHFQDSCTKGQHWFALKNLGQNQQTIIMLHTKEGAAKYSCGFPSVP